MQTFILDTSLAASAGLLDIRRRFKQAVECKQIYLALTGETSAWRNHPAVRQWKDNEQTLLSYGWLCLLACQYEKGKLYYWYTEQISQPIIPEFPAKFHKLIPFHRGLMLQKDYMYYRTFWPKLPSTGWARYLDGNSNVFHIKFGEKIYD